MRTLKQVLPEIPNRKHFQIPMVADSSNEVWVDLTTGLMPGQAWFITGGWWTIEPLNGEASSAFPSPPGTNGYHLQLHRNTDSELLLPSNDDDVIASNKRIAYVAAAGTLFNKLPLPLEVNGRPITCSRLLRMLFRTTADETNVSNPANVLRGVLNYEVIEVAEQDYVRHGNILKL
jgi:hypothetical protein